MASRERLSSKTQDGAAGYAGSSEFSRLKTNAGCTMDELREFMGKIQGRSAEEMLGEVAKSGLVRATCLATAGWVVLLVVCTVVPYYTRDTKAAEASKPAAAAQAQQQEDATDKVVEEAAAAAAQAPAADPSLAGRKEAAKELGFTDDSKEAPADKNPLDKSLDNLLEGIE